MPLRLKPLEQQTLVITGASSGIGLATARRACRRGAKVFLIARNAAALTKICDELTAAGGDAGFAVADVGDFEALTAAAQAAIVRFGVIDSWVNVAGVAIYAPLLDTPPEDHERLFRTNYWGVVNAARIAVPLLEKDGGAFVTVGSVAAELGTPILGAYAASKHAVKGFIDSLRIELIAAKAPISVTLIKPSGISTPLAEHAANHMGVAAKIPPTPYAPAVAARAILHAVQHSRREITVGGIGFVQTRAAAHVPRLSDWISSLVPALLKDRRRRAPPTNNLQSPGVDGEENSPFETAKPFSLFTGAMLHPGLAAAIVALAGVTIAGTVRRRSSWRVGARALRRKNAR